MTTEVLDTPTDTPTVPVPVEASPKSLYRWSTWVHVGGGAEECSEVDEQAGTNRCADSGHFHAWCRLPNPLQEREIRERAQAAKARRIRQLRSDGTDVNEILESELETLRGEPDAVKQMATELVGQDWAQDYLAAVALVKELDDESEEAEEGAKLYAHVDDDQARYTRLTTLPEGERSADEFNELQEHLAAYQEAVRVQFEAITNPKLETYEQMEEHDLFGLVRRKRIERLGVEEFMQQFSVHEWLSCALTQVGGEPHFRDLAHLENCDTSVMRALDAAFTDLEQTARATQGN